MLQTLTMLFFSPTGGTLRAARLLAQGLAEEITEVDLSLPQGKAMHFEEKIIVLIAGPVFGGRMPACFLERLARFTGSYTKAITIAVYGNRAYEDALLELNDTVERRGFQSIASAALLAEHSMVRTVAAGRPDQEDQKQISRLAQAILNKVNSGQFASPEVPGNRPYKVWKQMPVVPEVSSVCIHCGLCAVRCPVGAIPLKHPDRTEASQCILCLRCIAVCPKAARALPAQAEEPIRVKLAPVETLRRDNELFL